jgi:HlyD family secretion protein
MKKIKELFINKILNNKKVWIPLVLVIGILIFLFLRSNNNSANTVTDIAKYSDLKETILATGQVVSSTDLNLSFNTNGTVKSIKVKVGDKVKEGDVIATLDTSSTSAALTSARGALAAANARYKRILEGATNEEIALSEIILNQTKITQDTLVKNAYQSLLNSTPEAVPEDGSSDYTAPTISGTYNVGKEGKIYLKTYYSSGGTSFTISGLVEGTGSVDTITSQPIGNSGLFIKFPESTEGISDWVIEIPNKKAANYLANYNNYQATLAQAKAAVDQREAELAIKKSSARGSDIDLAKADIISASGQVEQAQARYNDTIIVAPVDGTITSIDIKQGELASASKPVIILQDVSNIYLEANINEANIANLKVGMPVDISYDAFGSDIMYKGNISKIYPSSTLISGVVNYKVQVSVEQSENLRPGMTANMTINVNEKKNVIAIPSRALLTDKDGNRKIRIVTNTRTKQFKEVGVTTGMEGDGSMIEIMSGLSENEEFVVLIKAK